MIQLFSASLLSVVGSFPMHLLPLLIAAVIDEKRMSVITAGWLGSALLIGQLVIVFLLPIFKINYITRRGAIFTCITLLLGLLISTLHHIEYVLFGWFVVGLSCGCLQFLGTTIAAEHKDKTFAFTFRLIIILFSTGFLIAGMKFFADRETYNSLIFLLAIITIIFSIISLPTYKIATIQSKCKLKKLTPNLSISINSNNDWLGLSSIFFLFMSAYGYWIYLLQATTSRGLSMENAAWIIATTKIIGAFFLLSTLLTSTTQKNNSPSLWLPSIFTSLGIATTAAASSLEIWALGLLFIELGFNMLSARLQAALTKRNPENTGKWLTSAILLGAAIGPLIYGAIVTCNLGFWLVGFTILSIFFPVIVLNKKINN